MAHHLRASAWLEAHGLEIEAFCHAAAASEIDGAERLLEWTTSPPYAPRWPLPNSEVALWLALDFGAATHRNDERGHTQGAVVFTVA